MATETGSIDDLLMGQKTMTQPETPEHQEDYNDSDSYSSDLSEQSDSPDTDNDTDRAEHISDSDGEAPESQDFDEYGNDKPASKTYTEDEVNERINKAVRDRLERLQRNQEQPSAAAVQQQTAQGFEYNPESAESWQNQLEQFVENTVTRMTQKQQRAHEEHREKLAQNEFEEKMYKGMGKFNDFTDVVAGQPITDHMVMATRGMQDPASFIYAASKRAPQELARIANIPDKYAQMMEMGKLEERMRKSKPGTNAPRPVSRNQEDMGITHKETKEPSIEDLIAKSDSKRRAQFVARRR